MTGSNTVGILKTTTADWPVKTRSHPLPIKHFQHKADFNRCFANIFE